MEILTTLLPIGTGIIGFVAGLFAGATNRAGELFADWSHGELKKRRDNADAARKKREQTPSLITSLGVVTAAAKPLVDELNREYMEAGRSDDVFYAHAIEAFRQFDDDQIRSLFHIVSAIAAAFRTCSGVQIRLEGQFAVLTNPDKKLNIGEVPIESHRARDVIAALSVNLSERGEKKEGACTVSVHTMSRIDVALRAAKLPKPPAPRFMPTPAPRIERK